MSALLLGAERLVRLPALAAADSSPTGLGKRAEPSGSEESGIADPALAPGRRSRSRRRARASRVGASGRRERGAAPKHRCRTAWARRVGLWLARLGSARLAARAPERTGAGEGASEAGRASALLRPQAPRCQINASATLAQRRSRARPLGREQLDEFGSAWEPLGPEGDETQELALRGRPRRARDVGRIRCKNGPF